MQSEEYEHVYCNICKGSVLREGNDIVTIGLIMCHLTKDTPSLENFICATLAFSFSPLIESVTGDDDA